MRVGIHQGLENTIDYLKDNRISLTDICNKLSLTRDTIANIRRLRNEERAMELLVQIQSAFPDYFENGQPKSSMNNTGFSKEENAIIKELREQIAYLKQENKRIAEENSKLINNLLHN